MVKIVANPAPILIRTMGPHCVKHDGWYRNCRLLNDWQLATNLPMHYWEIIADNLKKAGWSLGWVSAVDF
jgi:hypothetical protein